jgi:hypothetical protein
VHFALKEEAAGSSAAFVSYHSATWLYIPEDLDLNAVLYFKN